ncbi:hypothetical protein [Neomoorella thermoacetica]|nr:hypothetical protein [Moorella thermoacetica]
MKINLRNTAGKRQLPGKGLVRLLAAFVNPKMINYDKVNLIHL